MEGGSGHGDGLQPAVKVTPCVHCRAQVLVGEEDARAAALPYRLEPQPVDAMGELAATHAGLRTWTMHSSGQVYLRTPAVIASRPAGRTPRQQVHADHACRRGTQP
jgi:hypothetical protein